MSVKFILGYAIGVMLTCTVFFGLEMISLYENDIKKFFHKKDRKWGSMTREYIIACIGLGILIGIIIQLIKTTGRKWGINELLW